MLRSPLRRALATLSCALPVACGDSSQGPSSASSTLGSSSGSGGESSGTEAPTSGILGTNTGPGTSEGPTSTSTTDASSTSVDPSSSSTTGATTGDGTNTPPVALVDRYITKMKQPLVVAADQGLLKNDYDPDGDPITLVSSDPLTPGGAQVIASEDGGFTFIAPPSLWGTDSLGYKIWDGVDGFAQTKARIDLNPTAIDLEYVAEGKGGFAIDGQDPGDYSGRSVHAVGDLNGDGFAEVVVASRNAAQNAGRVYVVFGQYTGDKIALSTLEEFQKGYIIHGEAPGDFAGTSVAGAGDVNGDGKGDLIIGAPKASPNGKSSGKAYVVFGKDDAEPLYLDLVGSGNGGFSVNGEKTLDAAGRGVAGAGDVNGDGLADLIVGAYGADPGGSFSGAAYVVFGRGADKPTELSQISQALGGGFVINGETALDFAGFAVGGAGDVDGDGLDDLIVGAYGHDTAGDGAGRAYVVYGKPGLAPVLLTDVAAGQGGFAADGQAAYDRAGFAVSGAGDVDGDGFSDIIIGAPLADTAPEDAGKAYVVFGGPGLSTGSLTALASGASGFTLAGMQGRDYAGTAVGRAGDVDADGYDDVLVGAPGANPHGGDSGRTYVVFGDPAALSLDLGGLAAGDGGFCLDGEASDDYSSFAVSSADVNGDGHADPIVGARGNDGKGDDAGRTYVVFGGDYTNVLTEPFTAGPDNIKGSDAGEPLVGGRGGDLITLKGPDIVYSGAGDDDLHANDLAFLRVDGGAGLDVLRLTGEGLTLDLTQRSDLDIVRVETITLAGPNCALILAWRDLRALAREHRTISVTGASGMVKADLKGVGFVDAGVADGFQLYQHPVVTLRVALTLTADISL